MRETLKRRLWYIGDNRYRVRLPGEDPTIWNFSGAPGRRGVIFSLFWEGVLIDHFYSRVEVVCYLIRFAYSIRNDRLIPSELLADHNLAYEDGIWRDHWGLTDCQESISPAWNAKRPWDRKIRLEGDSAVLAHIPQKRRKGLKAVLAGFIPKAAKKAEAVPDEQCVFVLKSGLEAEKAHLERKRRFPPLQKGEI